MLYALVNTFFSHVTTLSCLPWLNQYIAEDKVSCSRTHYSQYSEYFELATLRSQVKYYTSWTSYVYWGDYENTKYSLPSNSVMASWYHSKILELKAAFSPQKTTKVQTSIFAISSWQGKEQAIRIRYMEFQEYLIWCPNMIALMRTYYSNYVCSYVGN